jgi:hypothetical protein
MLVQKLQQLLFSPHPALPGGSPLAAVAAQEAHQSLQQLVHTLGSVEGVFAGGLEEGAALPAANADAADTCSGSRSSSRSSSCSRGQQVSTDLGAWISDELGLAIWTHGSQS